MVTQDKTENNTNQQEETPPAQRVTLESLYRRAYDASAAGCPARQQHEIGANREHN